MKQLQENLRAIPAIDQLLTQAAQSEFLARLPHPFLVSILRQVTTTVRVELQSGQTPDVSPTALIASAVRLAKETTQPSLRRVVNATGVVLHTNLGRAPLSPRALALVTEVAAHYSTLEYNLETGQRGTRYDHVVAKLSKLSGAEDSLVVNNNAAAVLLTLSAIAKGREIIVSRGQLVEIGGSFRIPDVIQQSGAIMIEVGTTNKTHLSDYAQAISPNTAAILKVHTSNYRILGFTAQPEDADLVDLAHRHGIPIIEDLGSGTLTPIQYGDLQEPTVKQRLEAGVDLVTFSCDKLLGAGQAGVVAGRKQWLTGMKKHPLLRALRIDKLSLAALEGTLLDYLLGDPCLDIPVQRMLTVTQGLAGTANVLAEKLQSLEFFGWKVIAQPVDSQAGGGSLPGVTLPSWGVSITAPTKSAAQLEKFLRLGLTPIITRIVQNCIIIDVRCLLAGDQEIICNAFFAIEKGAIQ